MNTTESKSEDNAHIEFKLPESNMAKSTRPETKQMFKPKTNLPVLPNSVRAKRSGAVSRAGKHRWPQATMVVMGGNERQVFNTEVLTVTTHANKLEELKNDERSFDEKELLADSRVVLPNITEAEKTISSQEENLIPNRFAAKSPSKLSQLPAFSKNLLNEPTEQKSKESSKLIKSIKFWRGTTPNNQANETLTTNKQTAALNTSDSHTNGLDVLTKNDSVLQNWNEQVSVFEESGKNKYFSWQMALRNRLLKHEKMYYQEAVSRINKYRQQLKLKSHFGAGKRAAPPNMDPQLWKTLLQQHGEKKMPSTEKKLPGVSMSPTQEWKPYILKGNSKGQKNPPFFSSSAGNMEAKNKLPKVTDAPPATSSNKRIKYQSGTELTGSTFPVHGEALLKDEDPQAKSKILPNIEGKTPETIKQDAEKDTESKAEAEDDEHSATRALLVDLKKQLQVKNEDNEEKKIEVNDKPELSNNTFQGKNGLGMKLKLLLQNNNQNLHENSDSERTSARTATTARRRTRSRLHSQRSGYRPISRPRTIGDGSLPKIHNIVTTSLWKRHRNNKSTESRPSGTKHRLTLAGVANRDVFTSSVIGIAQKHIQERPKAFESKLIPSIESNTAESANSSAKSRNNKSDPLSSLVSNGTSLLNDFKEAKSNENNGPTETNYKLRKKKNPAYRLYTPATIQQHQFSSTASLSRIQEKENPQYKTLKLVSAISEKQKSPPATPLEQFHARKQVLKGKNKPKTGGKSKVLRVSVVEPPLTAKERFERQQEAEKSRKRLSYNPAYAALRNFSTAILNSELDLRAPSSSPVDMFFRSIHQHQNERDSTDHWTNQKQNEAYLGPKTADGVSGLHYRSSELVNQVDGLMPPRLPVHIEGMRLNSNFGQTNMKPSTAPKLKDIVDLQRLYNVMQKHGEAYTNGSTYFYSPTPNVGLDGMNKHQLSKHANKVPFYYYPYHGDTNIQAVNEKEGSPLYVVTGASSVGFDKRFGNLPKPKKNVHYQAKAEYQAGYENTFVETPFRHVLNLTKHDFNQWSAKPTTSVNFEKSSKHNLTVVMPKTPGIGLPATMPINQLEQIQEHVIQ